MGKDDRLLSVARPQVIVPTAGAVWGAAAILHAAHVGPLDPALATAALGAVVASTRARPVTTPVLAAGAWLTAAAHWGPLAGPHDLAAWILAAATVTGVAVAWRHPAVRAARERRSARHAWLHKAHRYRLHGSHLLEHEPTRLGDRQVFDTTGTGRLASEIARGHLAEQIAQDEGLPPDRVTVELGRVAGRIVVSRRFLDPWKDPIPHPVLDGDPELDLPVPCTLRDPVPLGQDPETGDPLLLPLYDEIGGKVVMAVAKRGEGKTTVLNNIRERVTAAWDADLWDINLSKGLEDRYWAPACEYAACGSGDKQKAFDIIQAACDLIDRRGATPRRTKVFQPTAADRLKVIVVDEIDALVAAAPQWVRKQLAYIASKGRSEGVILIIAGQRATKNWMAGGDVQANVDWLVLGRVRDFGEINHAAGTMVAQIPDMTSYATGYKGVWAVVEFGGGCQTGRAFDLSELTDIELIVAQREYGAIPALAAVGAPGGVPPENLPTSNLLAGNNADGSRVPTPPADSLEGAILALLDAADAGELSADLTAAVEAFRAAQQTGPGTAPPERETLDHMDGNLGRMPDDLEALFKIIDTRNRDTERILNETAKFPPGPDVPPEQMAESARQRWEQAAMQTIIPDDARHKLLALLSGDGMSGRKITEAFPAVVSRWQVMLWLNRLRFDKIAYIDGKGRGAKWRLTPARDGDSQ